MDSSSGFSDSKRQSKVSFAEPPTDVGVESLMVDYEYRSRELEIDSMELSALDTDIKGGQGKYTDTVRHGYVTHQTLGK